MKACTECNRGKTQAGERGAVLGVRVIKNLSSETPISLSPFRLELALVGHKGILANGAVVGTSMRLGTDEKKEQSVSLLNLSHTVVTHSLCFAQKARWQ